MTTFIVYTNPLSPFGRAVLATLEEKRAAYRLVAIGLRAGKKEPQITRHPFGKMPALEHNGFMLYETQAILRYIDRVQPAPALTPADPQNAARMDQILNICDWYLFQGVVNVIPFERIVRPKFFDAAPDEAVIAAALPKAQTVFKELNRLLGTNAYFTGAQVSLADLLAAAMADLLVRLPEWGPLAQANPGLEAWFARMAARPSLQATSFERAMASATLEEATN